MVRGIGNEGGGAKTMEITTIREVRKHDFHKLQYKFFPRVHPKSKQLDVSFKKGRHSYIPAISEKSYETQAWNKLFDQFWEKCGLRIN